jgi:hypothetical protein
MLNTAATSSQLRVCKATVHRARVDNAHILYSVASLKVNQTFASQHAHPADKESLAPFRVEQRQQKDEQATATVATVKKSGILSTTTKFKDMKVWCNLLTHALVNSTNK